MFEFKFADKTMIAVFDSSNKVPFVSNIDKGENGIDLKCVVKGLLFEGPPISFEPRGPTDLNAALVLCNMEALYM